MKKHLANIYHIIDDFCYCEPRGDIDEQIESLTKSLDFLIGHNCWDHYTPLLDKVVDADSFAKEYGFLVRIPENINEPGRIVNKLNYNFYIGTNALPMMIGYGQMCDNNPEFCIKLLSVLLDRGLDINHIYDDAHYTLLYKNAMVENVEIFDYLLPKSRLDLLVGNKNIVELILEDIGNHYDDIRDSLHIALEQKKLSSNLSPASKQNKSNKL